MNPRRRRHARHRRKHVRRERQLRLDSWSRYHKAGKELLQARARAASLQLRPYVLIPQVPPMGRYYYDRRFGA